MILFCALIILSLNVKVCFKRLPVDFGRSLYSDALHWITQIVLYLKDFICKCKYFSSDCCNVFDMVVNVFSFLLSKSVTGVTCTLLIINASLQSVQSSKVDVRLFEDLWWSWRLERKVFVLYYFKIICV